MCSDRNTLRTPTNVRTLIHTPSTFVRGAGGEATGSGDVVVLVLRQVVLDLLDQGEARGEGSGGRGGGGLGEEAARAPQGQG